MAKSGRARKGRNRGGEDVKERMVGRKLGTERMVEKTWDGKKGKKRMVERMWRVKREGKGWWKGCGTEWRGKIMSEQMIVSK